ncbi:hypothetical protein Agub_g8926, partial [Astrephomene gubernaculifera]
AGVGAAGDQRGGAPPSPLRARASAGVGSSGAAGGVTSLGSAGGAGRYGSRVGESPMRASVASDGAAARGMAHQDLLKGGAAGAAERLASDFARLQGPSGAAAAGLVRQGGASNAALPYVLANGRVKMR